MEIGSSSAKRMTSTDAFWDTSALLCSLRLCCPFLTRLGDRPCSLLRLRCAARERNPVVAVLLGCAYGGEVINMRVGLAAALVVLAVVLVDRGPNRLRQLAS